MFSELIIVICLAGAEPSRCETHYLPVEMPAMACSLYGQAIVQPYLRERPAWRLRSWRCGIGREA